MAWAVEWFLAVTATVVGLSHLLRPGDWAEAFRQLHRCGRPGAFANGALSLVPGAAVVAGHRSWAWPGAVLTAFGWLLIAKAAVCFLAPDKALRSMERGSRSPRAFAVAGLLLLAVAAWACYCLWVMAGAAQPARPDDRDGATSAWTRTELYMGAVPQQDWDAFLAEIVTPKFPGGLTVLDAGGQWRGRDGTIHKVPTRILVVLHPGTLETSRALDDIRHEFKSRFHDESVLRSDSAAAVSF